MCEANYELSKKLGVDGDFSEHYLKKENAEIKRWFGEFYRPENSKTIETVEAILPLLKGLNYSTIRMVAIICCAVAKNQATYSGDIGNLPKI